MAMVNGNKSLWLKNAYTLHERLEHDRAEGDHELQCPQHRNMADATQINLEASIFMVDELPDIICNKIKTDLPAEKNTISIPGTPWQIQWSGSGALAVIAIVIIGWLYIHRDVQIDKLQKTMGFIMTNEIVTIVHEE